MFGLPDYDKDYPELKPEITGLDIFMVIAVITGRTYQKLRETCQNRSMKGNNV